MHHNITLNEKILYMSSNMYYIQIILFDYLLQVIFENIGKFFVSFEPGPVLDTLDELFMEILNGVRSYPINFYGTTYHRAIQVIIYT